MQNDLTSQLIILYCSQMIVGSSHSTVVGLRTPFKTTLLFTISFIGHHRPVPAGFRIARSSAILIIVPPYRKWIEIQEVMQKKKKKKSRKTGSGADWEGKQCELVRIGKGGEQCWATRGHPQAGCRLAGCSRLCCRLSLLGENVTFFAKMKK